jgi:hypothetical protein
MGLTRDVLGDGQRHDLDGRCDIGDHPTRLSRGQAATVETQPQLDLLSVDGVARNTVVPTV